MATAPAAPVESAPTSWRQLLIIGHVGVAAVAALATPVVLSSLGVDCTLLGLVCLAWLGAATLWLLALLATSLTWRQSPRRWLLAGPLLALATIGPGVAGWWFDARLALSWPAMQSFAEHPPPEGDAPGRVGLYRVANYERFEGGFRFHTGDELLDFVGLAYCGGCRPPVIYEDSYDHLRGDWWVWHQSW